MKCKGKDYDGKYFANNVIGNKSAVCLDIKELNVFDY
jgi:hypothetical protein